MKDIWKPIYDLLSGDGFLTGLLEMTSEKIKIMKSFQDILPELPYIVMLMDNENPLVLGSGIPISTIRFAILGRNDIEVEEIASYLIGILDHWTASTEDVKISWCFWDGIPFTPSFEGGQWREDVTFNLASREKGV
jgi:hypothetical protein